MNNTGKYFSKTWLYLTFWFHFWLDSDLDVDALSEERRRLLAICSWRFSLASCLQEQMCQSVSQKAAICTQVNSPHTPLSNYPLHKSIHTPQSVNALSMHQENLRSDQWLLKINASTAECHISKINCYWKTWKTPQISLECLCKVFRWPNLQNDPTILV